VEDREAGMMAEEGVGDIDKRIVLRIERVCVHDGDKKARLARKRRGNKARTVDVYVACGD